MLDSFRSTAQAMSDTTTLKEAMHVLLERVQQELTGCECSIFLVDPDQEDFVLIDTSRTKDILPGQCRIPKGEGLVSWVAEKAEPIILEDALSHPANIELPQLGEESDFHAFLGAPIIHRGKVLGVLIAQHRGEKTFNSADEAFVVTLTLQLSSTIAHAIETARIYETMQPYGRHKSVRLQGVSAASGIAIGEALVIYPVADFSTIPDRASEDIPEDLEKFKAAVEAVRRDINAMDESLSESLSVEERALFAAYLKILDSKSLYDAVIERINAGQWVQSALKAIIYKNAKAFDEMPDDYLKERATDIRDIGRRILEHLQTQSASGPRHYPFQTILVGHEITASMLAEVPKKRLKAVISAEGSSHSHVAILANALGIPAVMGVETLPLDLVEGKQVIVDGYTGRIFVEPHRALLKAYERLVTEEQELKANLLEFRDLPAQTLDGVQIVLRANVGLIADIEHALESTAKGVGLYRSEVPFMIRDRFPGEEEQRVIYRQFLQSFSPEPVTMRVLDVGGDKTLPYFSFEEENPFLGWRGIRVLLDHPDIFCQQVRAMLKASVGLNNLQIMLPMVSRLSEIVEAKQLISEVYQETVAAGEEVKWPRIGIMIEVPSMVQQIDAVLRLVDFVSIGSNDLTQYLLAVDRNNSRVEKLYDTLEPSVLQAIFYVARRAQLAGKEFTICGEMAGDPLAVLLLVGMGFTSLSMSSTKILRIKWVVRGFQKQMCEALLHEALTFHDAGSVRQLLSRHLVAAGFGGLVRGGKH